MQSGSFKGICFSFCDARLVPYRASKLLFLLSLLLGSLKSRVLGLKLVLVEAVGTTQVKDFGFAIPDLRKWIGRTTDAVSAKRRSSEVENPDR